MGMDEMKYAQIISAGKPHQVIQRSKLSWFYSARRVGNSFPIPEQKRVSPYAFKQILSQTSTEEGI